MLRTMVRRKIPWLLVFEAVMMARERWRGLPAKDRVRLNELTRKSRGRPLSLTREERAEFRRIAAGLDLFGMAREFVPMGRRMGRRRH
jgi:hypothetical protein